MPLSHQDIEAKVHAYLAAFDAGDAQAAANLFAQDALLEDPVGGASARGREAIAAFYTQTMSTGAKLTLSAPVCSAADTAAFAFYATVGDMRIDVVELQHFNSAGEITHMKAYFSNENMHKIGA
jgi:steroid delta-isomerase